MNDNSNRYKNGVVSENYVMSQHNLTKVENKVKFRFLFDDTSIGNVFEQCLYYKENPNCKITIDYNESSFRKGDAMDSDNRLNEIKAYFKPKLEMLLCEPIKLADGYNKEIVKLRKYGLSPLDWNSYVEKLEQVIGSEMDIISEKIEFDYLLLHNKTDKTIQKIDRNRLQFRLTRSKGRLNRLCISFRAI